MLALQLFHLILHERKPQITVVIPYAKTSNGNAKVIVFTDPNVWVLAQTVVTSRASEARLWAGMPHHFRTFWRLFFSHREI